jgi:DNA-binding helix-hairpin-helix protein with protein kinase domain
MNCENLSSRPNWCAISMHSRFGNGRKRTLESYSIETAADLLTNKVETVPGFGPRLCGTLYSWRRALEARFVFNPATGVDPKDIAKIDQEISKERMRLEQAVRNGYSELQHLHSRILTARNQLRSAVEGAYVTHLQASADYKAASGE